MQASPFLRPCGLPSSQTDGVGPHICSAAITVLVFIPIPSSMCGPGCWDSPCCANPLLLCQSVSGSLSCWGTPGADTSRDPLFPSEEASVSKGESKCVLEALPLQESGEKQDEKPTNSFSALT